MDDSISLTWKWIHAHIPISAFSLLDWEYDPLLSLISIQSVFLFDKWLQTQEIGELCCVENNV